MTTYFDSAQLELGRLKSDKTYLDWLRAAPDKKVFVKEDAVRDWEEELVADCTIAVYFPGFSDIKPLPERFQQAVNQAVLDHGVYTLLSGVDANIETQDQFWDRLGQLCWHLHEVFHDIVRETGWSDNPRACFVRLFNEGYDDRDAIADARSS